MLALLLMITTVPSFATTEGPSITCSIEEWVNDKKVESYAMTGIQSSRTDEEGVTVYLPEMTKKVFLKSDPASYMWFRAQFEVVDKFNMMLLRIDKGISLTVRLDGHFVGLFDLPKVNVMIKGCVFKDGIRK